MLERLATTAVMVGVPFGLFMGLFFGWQHGARVGLSAGAVSGFLFGPALAVFAEMQRRKLRPLDDMFEGEPVLYQGPANHFHRAEARGGWLTLTATRLAFRSHGKNIQNHPLDIDLKSIASASPSRTAGCIPNGLLIRTHGGEKESFVVARRKVWADMIQRTAKAEPSQASQFNNRPSTDG